MAHIKTAQVQIVWTRRPQSYAYNSLVKLAISNAQNCLWCSECGVSLSSQKKGMDPIIVVAFITYHTPTVFSRNGILCRLVPVILWVDVFSELKTSFITKHNVYEVCIFIMWLKPGYWCWQYRHNFSVILQAKETCWISQVACSHPDDKKSQNDICQIM